MSESSLLAGGSQWTQEEIAALQRPLRPVPGRRPVGVHFPSLRRPLEPDERAGLAAALRRAADAVEAGYDLDRAEHREYARDLTLHFRDSGDDFALPVRHVDRVAPLEREMAELREQQGWSNNDAPALGGPHAQTPHREGERA